MRSMKQVWFCGSHSDIGGVYPDEMLEIDSALSARLNEKARLFAANMPIAASLARATGSLAIVDPFTARVEEKLGNLGARIERIQGQ